MTYIPIKLLQNYKNPFSKPKNVCLFETCKTVVKLTRFKSAQNNTRKILIAKVISGKQTTTLPLMRRLACGENVVLLISVQQRYSNV